MKDTALLYNETAKKWSRREPNSLSDFTGRPAVIDLCGDIKGKDILDLGCGEGYCSRILSEQSPASIHGIDISEKMIDLAKQQEETFKQGITYEVGNSVKIDVKDESYDLVLAVFLFNYLNTDQMVDTFREVRRVLKKDGEFVFAIPHPLFPYIKKAKTPPFYFDIKDKGYFSSKNSEHEGEIWCRDGKALNVQLVHKRLQDYFAGLKEAGFTTLPEVRELGVKDEHLTIDRDFFESLYDIPLHMAFKITK